ncbi:MauE/DoxX family redox-associated membrane protein [Streptacidiphilus sp. PAMC 29251]
MVRHWTQLEARLALAAVLTLSAYAKLRSRAAFAAFSRSALALTGGVGRRIAAGPDRSPARLLPAAVPLAEALLVAALLPPATAAPALVLTLLLIAAFTAVLWAALRRGETVPCNCFGTAAQTPPSTTQLLRNAMLLAIALLGCLASFPAPAPVGTGLGGLGVALLGAVGVAWIAALWDELSALLLG